jgi:glucokinase
MYPDSSPMTSPPYSIGVDIGGTSVKSVRVTGAGEVLAHEVLPIDASDPHWPRHLRELVAGIERAAGPAAAIGVAAPGIAGSDGRDIWWMQGRRAEVQELDWTAFLARGEPVPVLNDAQAALIGEAWLGAAAGCTNVFMLTLGTGVGGAAIVDGRLLRGNLGRAGHLGHICLDRAGPPDIARTPGSLESAIGNCTVSERTGGRFTSTLALAAAAAGGDKDADLIWRRSIHALACGIASLVNVLDPEIVLIGGGIAAAGAALFDPLRKELDGVEWRPHGRQVSVMPAKLDEFAGAIGAARNAMNATR